MAAISQTTFSTAFYWMKMFEFRLKFHWSLFLSFEFTIFQHWFRSWIGADQATSHYLNQGWKVYWRIYASLGLNELIATTVQQQHTHHSSPMRVRCGCFCLFKKLICVLPLSLPCRMYVVLCNCRLHHKTIFLYVAMTAYIGTFITDMYGVVMIL